MTVTQWTSSTTLADVCACACWASSPMLRHALPLLRAPDKAKKGQQ
ncbi:hypothetical protein [Mycobacterium dioxanotrophicus]|nr:hypothetical protein [Mycobacterium dioxanotrophicus]